MSSSCKFLLIEIDLISITMKSDTKKNLESTLVPKLIDLKGTFIYYVDRFGEGVSCKILHVYSLGDGVQNRVLDAT